jgi:hypothetical protein
MDKQQLQQIKELKQVELHQSKEWLNYWQDYSSLNHWQFWVALALLVIPLILLLLFMDKRKSLLLGFYGYNVHVFFTYIDTIGANNDYWFYPYKVFPILPSSFSLDASLIPVCYMFVYQWTLNRNKNYYIYMIGLSVFFALIFKPILEALRMFQIERGANFFHLLLGYLLVGVIAKLVTNFFLFLQRKSHDKKNKNGA